METRILLACLLAAAVLPRGIAAQGPPPPPAPVSVLIVQGTGEVRADPDEATVQLGVVAQAPTETRARVEAITGSDGSTCARRVTL